MDIDEDKQEVIATNNVEKENTLHVSCEDHAKQTKKGTNRRVSFPEDDRLVYKSVEPVDPWANGMLNLEIKL